jgi:hypothetical protein
MTSPRWINWEEKVEKFGLKPDGFAPDNIGMVPVFRIAMPQGYENAHITHCRFLSDDLDGSPTAWICRNGREYTVMTNVSYDVPYYFFMGYHPKTDEPLYSQRKRQDSVQWGPFKSLQTAVKELKKLALPEPKEA